MALLPELSGDFQSIDFLTFPPGDFVAGLVQLAMMTAAERYGELVADLHADGARLCKTQVMRIARLPTADEAGLGGDEFEMDPVVYPLGRGDGQGAFIDAARC
jgi:hypothetical protein